MVELERHIGDLNRDIAREAAQRTDAEATIERLQSEAAEIALTTDGADDVRAERSAFRPPRPSWLKPKPP